MSASIATGTTNNSSNNAAGCASKRKTPPASLQVPDAAEDGAAISSTLALVTPTAESPYETRMNALEAARPEGYVLWQMSDVLERVPSLSRQFPDEHPDDWTEEQTKEALATLTVSQVEENVHYLIVPHSVVTLQRQYIEDIYKADSRNEDISNVFMLDTYSSWCMYPVIAKQFKAAVKEINKATKAVNNNGNAVIPGIAKTALEYTLAAVLACQAVDHWRIDTEAPEECDKVAKKLSKTVKDLLWFQDEELGFVDPYSRQALLFQLSDMNQQWSNDYDEIMEEGISYKTKKNGQGLGRGEAPSPPPTKKPKAAPVATGVASVNNNSKKNTRSSLDLVAYLGGIQDKLPLRTKTQVQLQITSIATPSRQVMVVVTGAADMKKINQTCAFVTGHDPTFETHSQKGKCLKGSRIELRCHGATLWLGPKSMANQAVAAGASLVEDKSVKIVQVFQGLNCSADDAGISFDSAAAKTLAMTPGAVVWVAPNGQPFDIEVQAIYSNKCTGKGFPLPRIVVHDDEDDTTGFGMDLHKANRYLSAGRQGPSLIFSVHSTQAHVNQAFAKFAARPLVDESGASNGFCGFLFDVPANIQAAGPPTVAHL